MRFITAREVRNNPSQFREAVEQGDVVLTVSGKPFAIAISVNEDEVEETLDTLRRLRALRAMTRMQEHAAERGLEDISDEEVVKEIREARQARRTSP